MKRATCMGGFTLIELLVAVAVLALSMGMVATSFTQSLRARKDLEAIENRYHGLRLALNRLAREISMAYLSKNELPGTLEPNTFFVGEHHMGGARLSFSYLGHQRLYRDADEADSAVVTYFVESARDEPRRKHLYRRETRRLGVKDPSEKGAAYVACEDVERFDLEFWDVQRKDWTEEWNTKSIDGQPDRLPMKVRIKLLVRDERDHEIPISTEARVFMQDPIFFTGS